MKGKHKRKNKRNAAPTREDLPAVNVKEKQEHARKEECEYETDKSENNMNSISKWWHDPAHVIQSIGIFIGTIVALIYAGQLCQMIESNRLSREALEVVQGAVVSFSPPAKPVPVSYSSDPKSKKIDAWQLMVPITNDGGTPTKDGKVYWTVLLTKDPIADDFGFPDGGKGIAGPLALGPKHTFSLFTVSEPLKIDPPLA